MRKFWIFVCGSRGKYRQSRDFHLLSANPQEVLFLTSSSSIDFIFYFDSSGGIIEILRRADFSPTFIESATVLFETEDSSVDPFLIRLPRLRLCHHFDRFHWIYSISFFFICSRIGRGEKWRWYSIKLVQRYTTQSHLIRWLLMSSIQKIQI